MTKITLATVSELQTFPSAAANINSNSATIVTAMDNTISRDGTQPNSMNAPLDMNSNRILNLPAPVSNLEPARLADLEAMTGTGTVTINPVPTGGTTGQALVKNTNTNFDVGWGTIQGIPTGGTTSQILTKNTATNYDVSWQNAATPAGLLPTGGSTGQVLSKTSATNYATTWTTPSNIVGPGSSTDSAVVRWSGTAGTTLADSIISLDNVNARINKVGGGGVLVQGLTPGAAIPAGYVGEVISNTVAAASAVSATSGSPGQVWNSIVLTNGVWLVSGNTAIWGLSGTAVFTHMHAGIGPNLTSIPSAPTQGTVALHVTSNHPNGWVLANNPLVHYVSGGNTTFNACATADFTGGTAGYYGYIQAVRIA